jgi:hypothetical protein
MKIGQRRRPDLIERRVTRVRQIVSVRRPLAADTTRMCTLDRDQSDHRDERRSHPRHRMLQLLQTLTIRRAPA